MQQLAGIGSWEWDVERNLVEWSDELFRIYGLEPGSFAATFEGYLERLHPDDRERVTGLIGEAVTTGRRFEFEERIIRPTGEVRVLRSVGEPTCGADGRVVRLIGACQDVTAARETEAELRRSEAALKAANDDLERRVRERTAELARSHEALQRSELHFRALIENSSDIAAILAPDGIIRYESPSIQRVLGWTPEELVGRNALDFVHEEDRPVVLAALDAVVKDPTTTRRVEFRYRHRDGSYRVLESAGRGLQTGEMTGTIVNSRDITERRTVEEELRLQTALLRAQGEAAIDGILVVDPAGRIVSYNQRFVELWGIPPDVVAARSDAEAIAWVLDNVVDPAAFGRRIEYLYSHPHEDSRDEIALKDGRVLDRYSGPVRTADGGHYGRIWWFRDITDRYRFAEALEQSRREAEAAREQAERADRAKSEFLSRMSHELRTPLNSILGFAQLLQRKELPPDHMKSVEYILKGGRHLLNLINEVLEIARIEASSQGLSLEPVQLQSVVEESLMLIRPVAAEHGVILEDQTRCGDLYISADKQRLTQVLLNLLSNAVKYNTRGGMVRIRCGPPAHDPRRMRVSVEDTGRGIPTDRRDRLFTPFERLGAEQSAVEGTGLGLALSRRLIEAMGGALDFDSAPGVGSTFWFDLDAVDGPLVRLREVRGAEAAGGAGGAGGASGPGGADVECPAVDAGAGDAPFRAARILYIEDNLANLNLIESVIAARPGLELMPALQGSLGLELARRHHPDLILLDLHLPDLRGDEVLKRLKQDPATADIPIVFITADAMPGTGGGVLAAGADGYLTKPLDLDAFLATIDRILAPQEGSHAAARPA